MREKTSCTNHRMLWNYLQDICGCIVFFSGCYIFIRSFYVVWHHFISNKWLMQLMMTSINKPWSDLFPIAVYNWKTDENQFNTKACVMNRAEEHLLMGYSSRRPHSSSGYWGYNFHSSPKWDQTRLESSGLMSPFLLPHSDGGIRIWWERHESIDPSWLLSTFRLV